MNGLGGLGDVVNGLEVQPSLCFYFVLRGLGVVLGLLLLLLRGGCRGGVAAVGEVWRINTTRGG